jgi:hypothetical protein
MKGKPTAPVIDFCFTQVRGRFRTVQPADPREVGAGVDGDGYSGRVPPQGHNSALRFPSVFAERRLPKDLNALRIFCMIGILRGFNA